MAALYVTEESTDLSQTDQFREWTVRSIRECFYSSHKKGIDHHIVKVASKHHLKDWWFPQMVVIIQQFQWEGLDAEDQKKGRATKNAPYPQCHHLFFFFFFFILNAKIYNNILPITLPTKLLYDTTKTLPGGAICHDYPLAFNINLKKGEKKIHLNIPLNTKC